MDKTRLQKLLSRLDPIDDPDAGLEQYRTPADIAADVLWTAAMQGDLQGTVLDLGCGNGIFAIGAALAGCEATGIDIDDSAIATARTNLQRMEDRIGDDLPVTFAQQDIADVDRDADLVIMNPPFGLQQQDANLPFLDALYRCAPRGYVLLHRATTDPDETRQFIFRHADRHGYAAQVVDTYDFPIPARYAFHTQQRAVTHVDLYKFAQEGGD